MRGLRWGRAERFVPASRTSLLWTAGALPALVACLGCASAEPDGPAQESAQVAPAPPADPQTRTERGGSHKASARLVALHAEHETYRQGGSSEPFTPRDPNLRIRGDTVLVDCVAAEDGAALRADLEALGLVGGATYDNAVSGWLPISAIPELDGLASLGRAGAAMAATGAATGAGTGAATGAAAGAADPDPEPPQ